MEEGIQVVRVRTIKPVEEQLCIATRYARENLKSRVGRAIRAILAAHHENTAIGQNKCGWIPTCTLCKNESMRIDVYEDEHATPT